MPWTRRPLVERFWEKVEKSDGCWIWKGNKPRGYGVITAGGRGGKTLRATHVSWEIHRGPVPEGMWLLHRCDNPPCVNPDHLFLGTPTDNVRDMMAKGRYICPGARYVHLRRGENADHVLTEQQVRDIRRERASASATFKELGIKYGVHPNTIARIVNGETWRHLL